MTATPQGPAGTRQERSQRRVRWLLIAILTLLALRAALPLVTELALERVLSAALFARVRFGDVDLNLRKGEIVIEEATLVAAEGGAQLARAHRFVLDADWSALLRGRLEAERALLAAPELLLAYDDEGRFNWASVLDPVLSPPRREAGRPTPPPFRVRLGRLELGEGLVRLRDDAPAGLPDLRVALGAFTLEALEVGRSAPGAPLHWGLGGAEVQSWQVGIAPERGEPIDFELTARAGASGPSGALPIELDLVREGAGHFALRGELLPAPLDLRLQAEWEEIRSKALLPFLQVEGLRVDRGHSRGELTIAFTLADEPGRGLTARGRATHEDLALALESGRPTSLEVARIDLALEELHVPIPAVPLDPPEPVRLHWSRVEIVEPSLETSLGAREPGAADARASREASPSRIDVRVERLGVRRGRIAVRGPEPGDLQTVGPVRLDARGARWPRIGFRELLLEAGGVSAQPVRVQGSGSGRNTEARLRATRIELVPWNPAIQAASAYSVSRGALSLRSHFTLEGDDYEAPTRVTLHNLEAQSQDDAFHETFGVSLASAIQLLRDPAGNIQLDVPVRGTLGQGGRIDLAPAVAEALRTSVGNALVSTGAIAPDSAGSVLRRVGEVAYRGLGEAAFDAGDHEVEVDARAVLASAAALVRRTPGSRVRLVSEVVSDDLKALGVDAAGAGLVDSALAVPRALVGGGRAVEGEEHLRLMELSERRFAAVEAYLSAHGDIEPERLVRTPWDGKVREGLPRVLLRLEAAGD